MCGPKALDEAAVVAQVAAPPLTTIMLLSLFCNTLPTLSRKNSVSGVWQWTSQSMQRPAQAPESDPILLAKRKCQAASSAVRPVFGVLASGYAAVEMLMGSWWLLPMNNAPRAGAYLFRGRGRGGCRPHRAIHRQMSCTYFFSSQTQGNPSPLEQRDEPAEVVRRKPEP